MLDVTFTVRVAQIALAAVFAVAAISKLADLAGSRRAVAQFGVPVRAAGIVGVLLPLAELATAVALVPDGSARLGALAGLALLLAFSMAIALNLSRGRAPECRCFGQVHSTRVSWWTVARNLGLAALCLLIATMGAPEPITLQVACALVAVILVASLVLVRRGRTRAGRPGGTVTGLPLGADAHAFDLPASGGGVTLASLLERERPVVLVFTDALCGPCQALAPDLARWQREHAGTVTVEVIERGAHGDDVASAYGATGTPSAVLVGADGRIASMVAVGAPAIERLVTGRHAAPETRVVDAGSGLTRLELLARTGSAAAAVVLLGARDAFGGLVLQCRYVRCGNRCCPRRAVCRTRRGRKVCICPDDRETCGAKCCRETFICHTTARGKRLCVCPPRTRLCNGRCVPLTDPAHCGRCGTACPPATVCVSGECVGGDGSGTDPGGVGACACPPGETCCNGACVDLNTDEAHCGKCSQPCPSGQTCCDGRCKDLALDPQSCGECGKRCPAGEVCASGRCGRACPPGLQRCGGRCVEVSTDAENCGRCGHHCADLTTASLPACCNGECVDLVRPDHCGACFRECRAPCSCQSSRKGLGGKCLGAFSDNCPDNPPLSRVLGRLVARARARPAAG